MQVTARIASLELAERFTIARGAQETAEVVYVSVLSLWALVSGHWSAWQAARVEVVQQEAMRKAEEDPVEERVVEKIVEETTVQPVPATDTPAV